MRALITPSMRHEDTVDSPVCHVNTSVMFLYYENIVKKT